MCFGLCGVGGTSPSSPGGSVSWSSLPEGRWLAHLPGWGWLTPSWLGMTSNNVSVCPKNGLLSTISYTAPCLGGPLGPLRLAQSFSQALRSALTQHFRRHALRQAGPVPFSSKLFMVAVTSSPPHPHPGSFREKSKCQTSQVPRADADLQ